MSTSITNFYISAILTALINVLLVVFVVFRAPNIDLKRRFVWYGSSLVFWSLFLWLFSSANNQRASYIFCQLLHIGAIFIPCFFVHFVLIYLGRFRKTDKIILVSSYIVSSFYLVVNIFFPRAFIFDVIPKLGFPYFMEPGAMYHSWVVLFFTIVICGHIILFQGLLAAKGLLRKQRQFFFVGNLIGYVGGIGVFFPVYDITYFPFPYGAYGVTLFSIVTVYTIIKFRFIDIEVIIKKTLVFAGLFGMVAVIATVVTAVAQSYVGDFLSLGPRWSVVLSGLLILLFYNPTRNLLVHITDKVLFQKKEDIKVILNRLSEEIITILELENK